MTTVGTQYRWDHPDRPGRQERRQPCAESGVRGLGRSLAPMLHRVAARPSWAGPAVLIAGNAVLLIAVCMSQPLAVAMVAVIVMVPVLVAITKRPQRGVLALIALAPFNGLLLIVPHPGILNGWKEALVVVTLLATFLCPPEARRVARIRPAWVLALGALIGTSVVAAALDFEPVRAALGLKITFFYSLVAWTVLRCPFDERERDRFVTILMVTGTIVAVIGLLQQVAGPERMHAIGFEYNTTIRFAGGFFRSFSTFIQPFGFGFYMMAVLLVCTPVALSDRSRKRNAIFLMCTPVLALGMAATVVRGAFLGVGIGVAYLGASRYRILLLAFPLGLISLLVVPTEVSSAALSSSSTLQRTAGWAENLKVVSSHPLGLGPGTSAAAADRLAAVKSTSTKTYQPDNYYYHLAYEDGVLSVWFFCLLLASGFACARMAQRRTTGDTSALAAGIAAFLLAAAGASFVASFLEIFPMDVLTWLFLGLVAALAVDDGVPGPSRRVDALTAR